MLKELKERVFRSNLELVRQNLVIYTWGNVSGISSDRKYMVIKPSGVEYEKLKAEDMVVVQVSTGKIIEGELNPSSDTKTHLELYRAFHHIAGVTHTHSINAVAYAQAGVDVKVLGTTHADYFCGAIPCTREMKKEEVIIDFERNTGHVIVETFKVCGIDPEIVPGVLVKNHGPFTWGNSPEESVYHAKVLENICKMNIKTMMLNPDAFMESYILDKHFSRKHGEQACYGQTKMLI